MLATARQRFGDLGRGYELAELGRDDKQIRDAERQWKPRPQAKNTAQSCEPPPRQPADPDDVRLHRLRTLPIVKLGRAGSFALGDRAGDCFGEPVLVADSQRTATVTAETDLTCWALSSSAFRPIVKLQSLDRLGVAAESGAPARRQEAAFSSVPRTITAMPFALRISLPEDPSAL